MKANELRLGNWVIHALAYKKIDDGILINLSNEFIPIPLTEEWLLLFGFRKKGSFSDHTIHIDMTNILCLDNDNNESEFSAVSIYDVDEGVWIYLESIQYVHQLQNLYFALSGEELKLKDDENH